MRLPELQCIDTSEFALAVCFASCHLPTCPMPLKWTAEGHVGEHAYWAGLQCNELHHSFNSPHPPPMDLPCSFMCAGGLYYWDRVVSVCRLAQVWPGWGSRMNLNGWMGGWCLWCNIS